MQTIKVWDRFVRIFHWSLIGAIIIQMITAEDFNSLHVKIGYFIIVLLLLRIIWGFIGSKHARFKDFIYPPADVFGYLKGLFRGRPKHYLGHNPAGGAMVYFLLLFLVVTTLTGLLTYSAHGKGPSALKSANIVSVAFADEHAHDHGDNGEQSGFWKGIHETLVGIVIFLGCVHICGVIASSFVHKENLILAMISGYKKFE